MITQDLRFSDKDYTRVAKLDYKSKTDSYRNGNLKQLDRIM